MRPQGFGQAGAGLEDLGWNDMGLDPGKPEDSSAEVVPAHPHNLAGLTPIDSPVHDQQAEIAGRLSAFAPADCGEEEVDETAELYDPDAEAEESEPFVVEDEPAPVAKAAPAPVAKAAPAPAARRQRKPRAAAGTRDKAAFTLRLDPDRHLNLRLACAVDGRSAQLLVTQALDDYLAAIPELDAMAAKAKRKG